VAIPRNDSPNKSENDFDALQVALNSLVKPPTDFGAYKRMQRGHEMEWDGVSWPSAC